MIYHELGAAKVIDLVPHVGAFEFGPLDILLGHVLYERRHVRMLVRETQKSTELANKKSIIFVASIECSKVGLKLRKKSAKELFKTSIFVSGSIGPCLS